MRLSKFTDIDNALFEWFKNARNNNLPINGNILKLKADDFANLLNNPFKSNTVG